MKNTKHIYTTLWLLLSSMILSAAEISEQQALEHARQFMLQVTNNSQTASRRTMQHVSMRAVQTLLKAGRMGKEGFVMANDYDKSRTYLIKPSLSTATMMLHITTCKVVVCKDSRPGRESISRRVRR